MRLLSQSIKTRRVGWQMCTLPVRVVSRMSLRGREMEGWSQCVLDSTKCWTQIPCPLMSRARVCPIPPAATPGRGWTLSTMLPPRWSLVRSSWVPCPCCLSTPQTSHLLGTHASLLLLSDPPESPPGPLLWEQRCANEQDDLALLMARQFGGKPCYVRREHGVGWWSWRWRCGGVVDKGELTSLPRQQQESAGSVALLIMQVLICVAKRVASTCLIWTLQKWIRIPSPCR